MQHLLALFPVILTLVLAFKTRQMVLSFIAGIVSASLIAKEFAPIDAFMFGGSRLLQKTELLNLLSFKAFWASDKLFIFIFLIAVGSIIELIQKSGASQAYASFIKKHLDGRKQAEFATLGLSAFLALDDYFNVITTASVMRQVTDLFGIARLRCAQLVGNTAVAAASIFPASTWAAAITGTLASNGINLVSGNLIALHPFTTYLKSIPFALYPVTLLSITWITTAERILIGLAKDHQDLADLTTDVHSGCLEGEQAPEKQQFSTSKASLTDFLVPILTLIASLTIALLYTGQWSVFKGNNNLLQALADANLPLAMFLSGIYSFIISAYWLFYKKRVSLADCALSIKSGAEMMLPSVIVLTLSWTFGAIVAQDLQIGKIFVDNLLPMFSFSFLPPAFFVIAALTAFCLGSSWGTMALLYPIGIAIVAQLQGTANDNLLFQVIGAILSGAVLGNNTSPLADLSTMASSITETKHMDYVQAQIDFNRPVMWGCLAAFLTVSTVNLPSYGLSACLGLCTAILVSWISMKISAELQKR